MHVQSCLTKQLKALTGRSGGREELEDARQQPHELQVQVVQQLQDLDNVLPSMASQPSLDQGMPCGVHTPTHGPLGCLQHGMQTQVSSLLGMGLRSGRVWKPSKTRVGSTGPCAQRAGLQAAAPCLQVLCLLS